MSQRFDCIDQFDVDLFDLCDDIQGVGHILPGIGIGDKGLVEFHEADVVPGLAQRLAQALVPQGVVIPDGGWFDVFHDRKQFPLAGSVLQGELDVERRLLDVAQLEVIRQKGMHIGHGAQIQVVGFQGLGLEKEGFHQGLDLFLRFSRPFVGMGRGGVPACCAAYEHQDKQSACGNGYVEAFHSESPGAVFLKSSQFFNIDIMHLFKTGHFKFRD